MTGFHLDFSPHKKAASAYLLCFLQKSGTELHASRPVPLSLKGGSINYHSKTINDGLPRLVIFRALFRPYCLLAQSHSPLCSFPLKQLGRKIAPKSNKANL